MISSAYIVLNSGLWINTALTNAFNQKRASSLNKFSCENPYWWPSRLRLIHRTCNTLDGRLVLIVERDGFCKPDTARIVVRDSGWTEHSNILGYTASQPQ